MALSEEIRRNLILPAICAPMFLVSNPKLIAEARKAGLMAGLPTNNVRSFELLEAWMREIDEDAKAFAAANPKARIGPLAITGGNLRGPDAQKTLDLCERYGVQIFITAQGDPTEQVKRVHDWGGVVYHDVTTLRFAEKAIAAGVDGLICIGAGGGGHSGALSLISMIPKIRQMFDGVIVMAGAISNGAAIRAAEILGADLAYLGTRFIATRESNARAEYKQMLVSENATGVVYTGDIAGLPANWLTESMRRAGLDPSNLTKPSGRNTDHLPETAKQWKTIWSA
ncbi:MAG: nitronate monooxygenase, partial [Caulobacterales bacterium]